MEYELDHKIKNIIYYISYNLFTFSFNNDIKRILKNIYYFQLIYNFNRYCY